MKVAIVHECLTSYAGSERTIEAVAELFPDAPIYAIVYQKEALKDTLFAKRKVRTSFINQLPFAQTKHRVFLPLMPLAVEQHDLSEFDLIIFDHYEQRLLLPEYYENISNYVKRGGALLDGLQRFPAGVELCDARFAGGDLRQQIGDLTAVVLVEVRLGRDLGYRQFFPEVL